MLRDERISHADSYVVIESVVAIHPLPLHSAMTR